MNRLEQLIQGLLWQARWVMLLPVVGLLVGAVYFAVQTAVEVWRALSLGSLEKALPLMVGAVDLALLAAVLIIFALGIYELFIAEVNRSEGINNVLVVRSLNDLKTKLGQVILMILVVKFFEKAQAFSPKGALDFLYYAGAVALLGAALWLVQAKDKAEK
ncbi:MAG: YqhA family protein [Meiothermus sp.]|uniref:YqhA family protein n=1 Tax=Meiothermus sp. TaxID=1955249 RepID=UPI0026255660|nr:YqhA family protein [Meiothermus sp.]MCS7058272.1 YqhA family protein [Meiothermus sp.]MCX7739842.1 YqhA family protein [Meiothermus sp.]MDW8480497.1 YqhA family protein [Meiothermus sp.]